MTQEERTLVGEIKAEIDSLLRQYSLMVDTRAEIVKELKEVRAENEMLKAQIKLNENGRLAIAGLLPFKWTG